MVTPNWSWLLTKWSLEPSIVVGLILLSLGYLFLCGFRSNRPLSAQVLSCSRFQHAMFWISQLVLALALMSPLDYISDEYLFSAHMIQHLVLASVWPALLLLAIPEAVGTSLARVGSLSAFLRWGAFPAVALIVFNLDLSIWHIPSWYDLTLTNDNIHIFEHLTFMAAGVLVWVPIVGPIRAFRLSYGLRELYLFANLFPMMALGVFYSFWQHPLYQPYINAPRLWGIGALTDQQIGGLIMWIPGDLPFAVAMLVIGVTWLEKGDPAERPQLSTPVGEIAS